MSNKQAVPEDLYEVTIVRYGTRETLRSDVFLNYPFYGLSDGPMTVDYFFWVVRGPNRTFIVDTGFNNEAGRKRQRTTCVDPVTAMRSLGIDPEAQNDVIVTHAHYDHIGNLGSLPNSTVFMSRREYDFWTSEISDKTILRQFTEAAEIDQLVAAEKAGRMIFVENGYSPAPGITLLEISGHTPGQLAVLVETSEGPTLLASDAVHFYEEVERDMPFVSLTSLLDTYSGLQTVRDLQASGVRHLVTGHDASTLQRFRPQRGDLGEHAAVIGSKEEW